MERSTPENQDDRFALERHARILPFFLAAVLPNSNSMTVCPQGCSFQGLAMAIEAATPGSVITLKSGTYREGKLVIGKPLTIRGEGNPVLDGEKGQHHVLHIQSADGVVLDGLTFQNSGMSYTAELAGVRVTNSKNCVIQNSRFLDTVYGIYLEKTDLCRLVGNEFKGTARDESSSGNGIHIWNGGGHLISDNRVSGHRDGIYFEFVKGAKISGNHVEGNIRYGLHFMSSDSTEYTENVFTQNGAGVAVMYSKEITMRRNRFVMNRGMATYGLLLKDINTSRIEENQFFENTIGIYMEGSNRSSFVRNQFVSNGWGLRVMGNCDDNRFTRNNFKANTFDVTTNSEMNPNRFEENYWSAYAGYDLDGDGFGDKPFRPVSLSSIILERSESSFILLGSFLFSLLDEVERALPELIPERLKDERPLMREVP